MDYEIMLLLLLIAYILVGDSYCEPICDHLCINGRCETSSECKCPKGEVFMEDTRTCEVPECELECVNAECVGNNKCECHKSHHKDPNEWNLCVPHCSSPCKENSYCYFPEKCKCISGYRLDVRSGKCVPECNLDCINGFCRGKNSCTCDSGFKKVSGSINKCEPTCDGCDNGVCIAPGECKCNDMYQYNKTSKQCFLNCPENCKSCETPMHCRVCKEGYKIKEGSLDCEPECKGCENGVCIAPGECKCNDHYKYNETTKHCIPNCPKDCTQGCDSPMQCKGCEEGYKMKNGSFDCEPECRMGCKNGECSAPGVCICKEGYSRDLDNTECVPKCEPGCINGVCLSPNSCTCFEGYHLLNENICESDTESCRKSIENDIKQYNESCVKVHNPLRLYTENCSAQITNSSCSDEICSIDNHDVCSMYFICEVSSVQGDMNVSLKLQCSWKNGSLFEIDRRVGSDSNASMALSDTTTDMENDHLPLHFFRPDFDLKPCLLCLCPLNETREFCINESHALKLCPCASEKAPIITDLGIDVLQLNTHIVLAVGLISGLLVLALAALIIKCNDMSHVSRSYRVTAYSNNSYWDVTNEIYDPEHEYAEIIEGDGYEQPRTIVHNE